MGQQQAAIRPDVCPGKSESDEYARLFRELSPETKRRFVAWMEWAVSDGRPETDPRNCDPWWQEFERRRQTL